jgi:hypothetical protein
MVAVLLKHRDHAEAHVTWTARGLWITPTRCPNNQRCRRRLSGPHPANTSFASVIGTTSVTSSDWKACFDGMHEGAIIKAVLKP